MTKSDPQCCNFMCIFFFYLIWLKSSLALLTRGAQLENLSMPSRVAGMKRAETTVAPTPICPSLPASYHQLAAPGDYKYRRQQQGQAYQNMLSNNRTNNHQLFSAEPRPTKELIALVLSHWTPRTAIVCHPPRKNQTSYSVNKISIISQIARTGPMAISVMPGVTWGVVMYIWTEVH